MTTRVELPPKDTHPLHIELVDPSANPILLLSKRINSEAIKAATWTWRDGRALEDSPLDRYSNNAQIFRIAYGSSGTDPVKLTATEVAEIQRDQVGLKIEKAVEHALDIERAFLLGEKKLFQLGENQGPRRYTGGILHWGAEVTGSTGALAEGGTGEPTEAELLMWAELALGRLVFTGAWLRTYIDILLKDKLLFVPGHLTFGIPVLQIVDDWGAVNVTKHRLLTGPTQWLALYPRHLGYRYLRDTTFHERTWEGDHAGIDGPMPPEPEGWFIEEYITEAGLEFTEPGNVQVLKK